MLLKISRAFIVFTSMLSFSQQEEIAERGFKDTLPLFPIRALRDVTGDEAKLTVEYAVNDFNYPVVPRWYDFHGVGRLVETRENRIPRRPSNVRSTSVVAKINSTYATLYLGMNMETTALWYRIDLTNTNLYGIDYKTSIIDFPRLELPNEVVYEHGENVEFRVTVEDNGDLFNPQLYFGALVVGPGGQLEDYGPKPIFEVKEYFLVEKIRKRYKRKDINFDIKLKTAEVSASGFLEIFAPTDYLPSQFVRNCEIHRKITLRPADQEGPFPPAFLQFYDFKSTVDCWRNMTCLVKCNVFGSSLVELRLQLELNAGTWESLAVETNEKTTTYKYLDAILDYRYLLSSQDRLRCTAIDAEGQSKNRIFTVNYV